MIAVPGLGSHAIGSWKSPSGNDLWLRDYLPDDIPNIRVLLYGYDTSLLGSDSKDSLQDLGIRFLESVKAFRADIVRGIREYSDYVAHSVIDRSPSNHIHWPQFRRLADKGGKAFHISRRSENAFSPHDRHWFVRAINPPTHRTSVSAKLATDCFSLVSRIMD